MAGEKTELTEFDFLESGRYNRYCYQHQKYCMGGCLGGLDSQNIRDTDQLIEKIKKAPNKQVINLINNFQQIQALKSYYSFLEQLRSLFNEEDKRKYLQEQARGRGSTYTDRIALHTNELMSLAKKCDQSRRILEEQCARIQSQVGAQKDKLNEHINVLFESQKRRPIKSRMIIEGDENENSSLTRKEKVDKCLNKIATIIEDADIQKHEVSELVLTQVQSIIKNCESQIDSLKQEIGRKGAELQKQTENNQRLRQQMEQLKQKVEDLTMNQHIEPEKNVNVSSKQPKQHDIDMKIDTSPRSSIIVFKKFINSKVVFNEYRKGKQMQAILESIFSPNIIESSHLLFSYDKVRPNNMLDYIKEGKRNLILLARLENGTVIGGFSRYGFRETVDNMANNYCFIFSIQPEGKHCKLELKGQGMALHSVKLNRDYLKFGANEIRITCGSDEGRSTLNTRACIFGCKDREEPITTEEFLGMSLETYRIDQYEIFQLAIEQKVRYEKEEMVSLINQA